MEEILQSLYAGFPVLIIHFVTTIIILVVATFIYIKTTPHLEFELIKEGNVAAAISLSGVLLGLAVPLAFCLAGSMSVYDLVIWGVAILAVQLITYYIIDHLFLFRGISKSIKKQEFAPVIFLVGVKLSVAAISAAAITG